MANVRKRVHNLRLHNALIYGEIPLSESNSRLNLRVRELQLIFAEFMGFFSMFAIVFMQLYVSRTSRTGSAACPSPGEKVTGLAKTASQFRELFFQPFRQTVSEFREVPLDIGDFSGPGRGVDPHQLRQVFRGDIETGVVEVLFVRQ